MLRIDTLELKDITAQWVVDEINNELETLKRIRRTDFLTSNMAGSGGGEIGFPMKNDSEEEELEEEVSVAPSNSPDLTAYSAGEESNAPGQQNRPSDNGPSTQSDSGSEAKSI